MWRLLNQARPDMFGRAEETAEPMNEINGRVAGGKRLPPHPQRLAEIIANTGHHLSSAVADIVDNAISADATEIDINFSPPNSGRGRWLTIRDNGHGMSESELAESMTLGSDVKYEVNSLGKFGYGLKGRPGHRPAPLRSSPAAGADPSAISPGTRKTWETGWPATRLSRSGNVRPRPLRNRVRSSSGRI